MKKEKLNKYPTHPFVVAMENKAFASSALLFFGAVGTFVYGLVSRDTELTNLGIVVALTVAYGSIGLSTPTINAYQGHINRYVEGDPLVSRDDYFDKTKKHNPYCANVGIRRAARDIKGGKVKIPLDRS